MPPTGLAALRPHASNSPDSDASPPLNSQRLSFRRTPSSTMADIDTATAVTNFGNIDGASNEKSYQVLQETMQFEDQEVVKERMPKRMSI